MRTTTDGVPMTTMPTSSTPTDPMVGAMVTSLTITVDDPAVGRLTFNALAAGDPSAAAADRLIVLLHGFPETAESFREMLAPLGGAGFYAVALTQRGYSPGARPAAVESYDIRALVDDVLHVADKLGAHRFHLVGHDWGGAVAWVAAALHPDVVTTVSILSTPHPDALSAAVGDPADTQSHASGYMKTLRADGAERQILAGGPGSFVTLFTAGGLPRTKAETYARTLGTPDALGAALNWYRANPLPTDRVVGPIRVPTLYLWGADDGAFTRSTALATAAYVTGPYQFREIPGHSHWLPEELPAQMADEVIGQVQRHS